MNIDSRPNGPYVSLDIVCAAVFQVCYAPADQLEFI